MSASFIITEVGKPQVSKKSRKPYIRCKTDQGIYIKVAGKKHVAIVQKFRTPFKITCEYKPTTEEVLNSTGVTFLIKANYPLYLSRIRPKHEV